MSRFALAAACIVAGGLATPVLAEAPTISCSQARAQVTAQGAAIVRSSPNVYDRYVTDRRFCAPTQGLRLGLIATTDTQFCPVGYRCEETFNSRFAR